MFFRYGTQKAIIPIEIDFLYFRPLWDVKEIQYSTVVALEGLNSEFFGFFFVFIKTNSSQRLYLHENIYSTIGGLIPC
jgi:hypothetical protein